MKNNSLIKKSFFDGRAMGVLAAVIALIGVLLLGHHIASYEVILRPQLDYLIENKVHTNSIGGRGFFLYFTNQSNIFMFIYLFLFAAGSFGCKKLYDFTRNDAVRGAVTLYIAVTGLIYCAVIMPFSPGGYPWTEQIWFSNIVNYWLHIVNPVLFFAFWFRPINGKKLPVVKISLIYMIYPLCYLIFSLINGAIIKFYPYPFLNAAQLWNTLFPDKPYETVAGALLLAVSFTILVVLFFALGAGIAAMHNSLVKKFYQAKSERAV